MDFEDFVFLFFISIMTLLVAAIVVGEVAATKTARGCRETQRNLGVTTQARGTTCYIEVWPNKWIAKGDAYYLIPVLKGERDKESLQYILKENVGDG